MKSEAESRKDDLVQRITELAKNAQRWQMAFLNHP
jgi:hypothetical protein